MDTKSFLLAMALVGGLTGGVAVDAQKPRAIKGGKFCESYLLKKIAKEKAPGSRILKLSAFDTADKTLPPALKEWLDTADEKKLVALELRHKEKKALILSSNNVQATGLATNFRYWYVQLDGHSIEFISLSENPHLTFWGKDGSLNYYAVDFSSEFIHNKDWDDVTLDLLRYRINPNGESELVSKERDVRCK